MWRTIAPKMYSLYYHIMCVVTISWVRLQQYDPRPLYAVQVRACTHSATVCFSRIAIHYLPGSFFRFDSTSSSCINVKPSCRSTSKSEIFTPVAFNRSLHQFVNVFFCTTIHDVSCSSAVNHELSWSIVFAAARITKWMVWFLPRLWAHYERMWIIPVVMERHCSRGSLHCYYTLL